MNTNPLKELERKLAETNTLYQDACDKDREEVDILSLELSLLEEKITPLRKKLKELKDKTKPLRDSIASLEEKIANTKYWTIGPWVFENHDARLYLSNKKRDFTSSVVWFRGVSSGYPNHRRTLTASIWGCEDMIFPGACDEETMCSHFHAIEERCKEVGYFILDEE